jgi:hypothetical protein
MIEKQTRCILLHINQIDTLTLWYQTTHLIITGHRESRFVPTYLVSKNQDMIYLT